MPGRLRRRAFHVIFILGALALSTTLAVAGCGTDADVDNTLRDAGVYEVVIADLADRATVEPNGTEDLPVLFVESFGTGEIAIEVQVEIVTAFIDEYEIRFIDDMEEAIDDDLDHLPVRAGSLLVGVGPILVDGTADLRGELYTAEDDIQAYRYSLVAAGGGEWIIVGSPEEIDPEGFEVPS